MNPIRAKTISRLGQKGQSLVEFSLVVSLIALVTIALMSSAGAPIRCSIWAAADAFEEYNHYNDNFGIADEICNPLQEVYNPSPGDPPPKGGKGGEE